MPEALSSSIDSIPASLSNLYEIGGTATYIKKRDGMRRRLHDQLPKDLLLSPTFLANLPLDVMGVPASCGLLTAPELAITALDATAMRDKVAAGELTAVAVVSAIGRRAAIAQQLTCCKFLLPSLHSLSQLRLSHRSEGLTVNIPL
jgi:amidase